MAVMPAGLCTVFVHQRDYPVLEAEYRNGESQRSIQATHSRRRWRLSRRVTPAQLAVLRAFYEARKGPIEPFYFYDTWETVPKFSHDPTGQAIAGRYKVRFAGSWQQSVELSRADVAIELVEVA